MVVRYYVLRPFWDMLVQPFCRSFVSSHWKTNDGRSFRQSQEKYRNEFGERY
jgi:hypothetical protein